MGGPIQEMVDRLGLERHPGGGWFRAEPDAGPDGASALWLLEAGDFCAWHRLSADELWRYEEGGPVALTTSPNGHDAACVYLGPETAQNQIAEQRVEAGAWRTAESLGAWSLVRRSVLTGVPGGVPGGDPWAHLTMAPPDWRPTPRS
ncbi:MAG: cupin domain-containing protein [Pseudomonadota bacterium]